MHDTTELLHLFVLNVALILMAAAAYGPLDARLPDGRRKQYVVGLMFGLMAVGCMSAPLELSPGMIIDLRFTAVMLAGPYGGPFGAITAAATAGGYRLLLGGDGTLPGVMAIVLSGAAGIAFAATMGRLDSWRKAGLAGLLLALAVLLPSLTYGTPAEGLALFQTLALPLLGSLPLSTVIVCHLLTRGERNRTAEARLAASEERYRQIVNVASDWFWETDAELRLTHFSDGAIPEHVKRTLIGKRRDEVAVDPNDAAVQRNLEDMRNRRVFRDFRHHMVPMDGGIAHVSISGAPCYDQAGQFTGYIGSGRDITAEVTAEAALKQARHQAIAANEAKSAFLANMSHEIRTPMTGMLGMLDMLERTELSREQRRYVDTVRMSADSLLSIVNDVLDLSKIEAGSLRIETNAFDLRRMLEGACAGPAAAARGKGLEFTLDVAPDLGLIAMGDSHRIAQILANFLSNAVRFTDRGGIGVSVTPAAGGVAFAVSDSGIGIPAHKLEQVFRPFEQADASTTRRFGGTGLGLAICRRLAEAMGGSVSVRSVPGAGSTFTLHLPLTFTNVPLQAVAAPAPDGDGPRVAARLLIAEDNEVNALLLRTMLAQRGYAVTLVGNGQAAVDAVGAGAFDAVLMDMHMPVLDGVEATRRIRALPAPRGEIPIFALTADALHQNRARYQGIGLTGFLTKPIDWDALDRAIADHVTDTPVAAAPADEGPTSVDDARETTEMAETAQPDAALLERIGKVPLIDTAQQDAIRRSTGAAVFRQLADLFVGAMAADLARLADHVAQGDAGQQKAALHSLRGQAGNLGAGRLAAAARACEDGLPDRLVTAAEVAWLKAIAAETNGALEAVALAA